MPSEERLISIAISELTLKDTAVSGLDKKGQKTYLAYANMGFKKGLYTSPALAKNLTVVQGTWLGGESFDPATHPHCGRITL